MAASIFNNIPIRNIPNINLNNVAQRAGERVKGVKSMIFTENEIEKKVKEATSNERWNASNTMLNDLASASFNYGALSVMMPIIWKRIEEKGKHWRYVYKSLVLLDFLLVNGDEAVARMCRDRSHMLQLSTLSHFEYIDSEGADSGENVRKRAKKIVEMIKDSQTLAEMRKDSKANKKDFVGFSHDQYLNGSYDKRNFSSSSSGAYNYDDPYRPGGSGSHADSRNDDPYQGAEGYGKEEDIEEEPEEDLFESPDASPKAKPVSADVPPQEVSEDFLSDGFSAFVSAPTTGAPAAAPSRSDNVEFTNFTTGNNGSEGFFENSPNGLNDSVFFDDDFNPRGNSSESNSNQGAAAQGDDTLDLLDLVPNVEITSQPKPKPATKGKPHYVPMGGQSETRTSGIGGLDDIFGNEIQVEKSPEVARAPTNVMNPNISPMAYDRYAQVAVPAPYITMMPIQDVKAMNPNFPVSQVNYFQKDWVSENK